MVEKAGKLLLQKPDKVHIGPGGKKIVMPDFLNVLDTITALEAKVADLTQRLAKLE